MLTIHETPSVEAPERQRRWGRVLRWALAAALVVVAAGLIVFWWVSRPPAPVSVNDVIDNFRNASPSPVATSGGPPIGVYLYATQGSEQVSAGHVTHRYPHLTTLTVTPDSCGLTFRWDALAGRYGVWRVCRTATAWALTHYVDVHTFLYMKDVHAYDCSGFPVVVCRTDTGVLTSTVASLGGENVLVHGVSHPATHLRITQDATGKSVSTGTIDAWVLPSGLPAKIQVVDHGSQTVLGSHVTYDESATFVLTSTKPRR